jgi:hypothetical protein
LNQRPAFSLRRIGEVSTDYRQRPIKDDEIIQRKESNFLKLNNERPERQYWRGFKHNFATETERRDIKRQARGKIKNGHFAVAVSRYSLSVFQRIGTLNASRFASKP